MNKNTSDNVQMSQEERQRENEAMLISVFKLMFCLLLIVGTWLIIMVNTFGPTTDNGRDWRTSVVDGTVSMLSSVTIYADVIYAIACIGHILGKLGVPVTKSETPIRRMVVAGTVLAAMNGVSYFACKYRDSGGWNWDRA